MLPDIPTVHVQLQELLHLGFDPLDEVEVLSLLSFHGCVVMFSAFRSVDSHLSSNKDGARLDRTGEPLLSLGEVRDEGPNTLSPTQNSVCVVSSSLCFGKAHADFCDEAFARLILQNMYDIVTS